MQEPAALTGTSRPGSVLGLVASRYPRFDLLNRMSGPPTQSVRPAISILDAFPGIAETTADLRDVDGELNADRVREVFGFPSVDELARVAGIRMPSAPELMLALETLEKIARVRAVKQLSEPQAFRAWWHRKIPSLGDRSPYDTWLAGNGQTVVELVDRVLVGDTRG